MYEKGVDLYEKGVDARVMQFHTHIVIFLCNPRQNLDHTVAVIVQIQNHHLQRVHEKVCEGVCVRG